MVGWPERLRRRLPGAPRNVATASSLVHQAHRGTTLAGCAPVFPLEAGQAVPPAVFLADVSATFFASCR